MKYYLFAYLKFLLIYWICVGGFLGFVASKIYAQSLSNIVSNTLEKQTKQAQEISKKLDILIETLKNTSNLEKYTNTTAEVQAIFNKQPDIKDSTIQLFYLKKIIQNAKQRDDTRFLCNAYLLAGNVYKVFYKEKGLDFLKKAQLVAEQSLDKDLVIRTFRDLGFLYVEEFSDFKQGIIFFLEALRIAKKNNLTKYIIDIHGHLILSHYQARSYIRAKEYAIDLFKNYENEIPKREKISHNNTIALCEMKLKNEASAERYYQKAISLAKEYKDTVWIGLTSGNLASLYIRQKKYEPAIKLLRIDILYSEKYKEWENSFISHLEMALCCLKMKDEVKADIFYQKASYIYHAYAFQKRKIKEQYYNMSLEYYLLKSNSSDKEKILEIFYGERDTRDSLTAIIQTENIAKVQSNYDAIQKQDVITRLQKEREAQDRNVRLQYYLITGLVFMIVAGGLGTFILYFVYIKNRKLTKQLQNQNKQITAQNEQIITQSEELEKSNATKDKLFSVISHDFRSPLANLSSVFRLLQDKSITQTQFSQFVPDFQRRLDVTLGFVDNLLYWAKSQMYGVEAHPQMVNIKNIIRETLELIQSQTEKKKIEIIDESQQHTQVFADANMVRVIFRNLLGNAIKFSFDNSKIWLMAWQVDNMVKIGIKDEGMGMTPTQIENLFKDDELRTTLGTNNEKGTGLGLLLCHEFVVVNGGKMEVESKENEGTTFYFYLPKNK